MAKDEAASAVSRSKSKRAFEAEDEDALMALMRGDVEDLLSV